MTVKEIVTNEIIEKLKSGVIPWHKPWEGGEAVNYMTQKPYTGINRLLLEGGEYITYKQVKQLGGSVKKGAKTHTVVFYKNWSTAVEDADGNEVLKTIPVMRYYKVFRLADTEGIESKQLNVERPNFKITECEGVVSRYIDAEGIDFDPDNVSSEAFYSPSDDRIVVPNIRQHDSAEAYYSTLYHEMVHSTGHSKRLNRLSKDKKSAAFGSETYSREELVAELGSAILCAESGIDTTKTLDNSAGYIQGWCRALQDDSNAIIYAAAKAEKAVDYIKGKSVTA